MRIPMILTLLGASLAASAAAAQAPDADVKCLLAANVFSQQEQDASKKQMAMATGMFFTGRIDARLSPVQLKAQIMALSKTLKPTDLGPIMNACAQQFAAKERALQEIGKSIAGANAPAGAAPAPKPPAK